MKHIVFLFFILLFSNLSYLNAQDEKSAAEDVVSEFLIQLAASDFQKAYNLTSNPSWGDYERFSSTQGFGGITFVAIDTVMEIPNLTNNKSANIVFANYFAADTANTNGTYRFDFHVNENLKIEKITKHYFDKYASIEVYDFMHRIDHRKISSALGVYCDIEYHFFEEEYESSSLYNELLCQAFREGTKAKDYPGFSQMIQEESQDFIDVMKDEIIEYRHTAREIIEEFRLDCQIGDFISFSDFIYSYTGGAHGNYGTHLSVIDAITKERVTYNEILDLNSKVDIEHLIYAYLWDDKDAKGMTYDNKQQMMSRFGSIEDFENGSYGLSPKGIVIKYAPYVIGSFAEGEYTVILSWDDVRPFLKADFKKRIGL